jgi:NDP-sugar pyrophosphorylase family protein
MHAVILAGGKGVRLRPYTTTLPKPLMPIGDNHAILEIVLNQLADCGFRSVTLAINHLGALIRAFVGDGARWGLRVDYVEEDRPLSTVGPLFNIRDRLPEHFLVMNGDILSDLNYAAFLTEHARDNHLFSVSAARREQKIDYGVLHGNDQGRLVGFEEKPTIPYLVSMGVYGLSRRILDWIPRDQAFGFDQLVLKLLADVEPVEVRVHTGYWLDIGRPDDYQRAVDEWPTLRASLGI